MTNMTIENYFNISKILKTKKLKDFQAYQKKVNYTYNKDEKFNELNKFYKDVNDKNSSYDTIFKQLNSIRKLVLIVIFLITFLFTYNYFTTEINVKTYLLFSVALPLLYSVFALTKVITYKYPQKYEVSFLNSFLKRISSSFDKKHNHIIKTYSIVLLIEMGISYALAILVATMIIFWSQSITFYSQTTYNAKSHVKDLINKQDRVIESKSFYSKVITIAILFVIFLKIILRYFAIKIMNKTILNSLEEQAKIFFDLMQQNTLIYKKEIPKEKSFTKIEKNSLKIVNNSFSDIYYKLYYEIDFDEIKKIVFNDDTLDKKTLKEYSFALFDQEDEDDKVLSSLQNLILIFASPESLADETFRGYIKQMLQKDNIVQIWILPLVRDNDNYILAQKGDSKYLDWKDKIENIIDDDRVSLYNER